MPGKVQQRLQELGVDLPTPGQPAANYSAFKVVGRQVVISGQLPRWNNELKYCGKLGSDLTIEDGYQAARLCGLNLIAHLNVVTQGDLDQVAAVVRLNGYVACVADFFDHAQVLNGCSDLMVEVFGKEVGDHTRLAIGNNVLPFNAAVEFDGVFSLR